jgi:hypothetical protein
MRLSVSGHQHFKEQQQRQMPINNKKSKPEIFVIMEGGVVHEIVNLPSNINVTVIDYDTEGVEKERLEISPIDGDLCVINKW